MQAAPSSLENKRAESEANWGLRTCTVSLPWNCPTSSYLSTSCWSTQDGPLKLVLQEGNSKVMRPTRVSDRQSSAKPKMQRVQNSTLTLGPEKAHPACREHPRLSPLRWCPAVDPDESRFQLLEGRLKAIHDGLPKAGFGGSTKGTAAGAQLPTGSGSTEARQLGAPFTTMLEQQSLPSAQQRSPARSRSPKKRVRLL